MADEKYTFEQARIRLEEIAAEVRKKDTSLEKSLDLLEEGVRLANICTELVDHPDVSASVPVPEAETAADGPGEGQAVTGDPVSQEEAGDNASIPTEDEEAQRSEGSGNAPDDADPAFDSDGFDDVEEPSLVPSDEDAQD